MDKVIETYYCKTCGKIHPKYLKGCLNDEERRRQITIAIINNTKSF